VAVFQSGRLAVSDHLKTYFLGLEPVRIWRRCGQVQIPGEGERDSAIKSNGIHLQRNPQSAGEF